MEVTDVLVDDDLDFVTQGVLQDIDNLIMIVLRKDDGRLSYVLRFAIPVGDEVFAFVSIPVIEVVMMLYTILTKARIYPLGESPHTYHET